ncbi:STAS domain-containing protein [bacterium]|nr:STAS domain-containing protein [bacterium]
MKAYQSRIRHTLKGLNYLVVKLPKKIIDAYPENYSYEDINKFTLKDFREKCPEISYIRAEAEFDYIYEKGYTNIAFDCSDLEYVNSFFIRYLVLLYKNLKTQNENSTIIFINLSEQIVAVLEMMKLTHIFDYVKSEEELVENH